MTNTALLYALGEFFCMAIMLILTGALKPITNYGKREKWLAVSLVSETLYFLGDALDKLQTGGVLPASQAGLLFTGTYKLWMLDFVSLAVFFYIDQCGEFSLADSRSKRMLVCSVALLNGIFELFVLLINPGWLLTAQLQPTLLYNLLLLLVPLLYSLAAIGLAINGIRQSPSKNIRQFYLTTASWPMLLVIFGGLDIYVDTFPFYAYVATACLLFLAVYQFRTLVDTVSLGSLSNIKGREKLRTHLRSIQRRGSSREYYLLLIDMNGLRSINDIYGRSEGDRVLFVVSQAVEQLAEKMHGFSCHYGGDEFLAVVKLADDAAVKSFFDDMQEEVKHLSDVHGLSVSPQLVTSAVRLDMADGDLAAQLRIAEEKVYHQKRDLDGEIRENNFFVDKVTGLPNTNYFHSFACSYLKSCLEKGDTPAVVLINVSNMQAYNNRYGFEKGDQLLLQIAQILQKFFKDGVLVRFAEDNFLLATDAPDLVKSLEEAADEVNKETDASIRAGVYHYKDVSEGLMTAVDKAKRALRYLNNNRAVVCQVYNREVREEFERRGYVLENFQKALDEGWIRPYFQLESRSLTGRICGAEALARWVDPKYGVLGPNFFIEVLEEAHLVHKLDLSIIRQVCAMLARRREEKKPLVPISVNLSRVDFQVCDIFAEIEKIRQQFKLPSSLLKIEILESTVTSKPQELRQAIANFHKSGYEVWMDDFGSGYSNFNNLDEYDFDLLKIDMVFLRDFNSRSKVKTLLAIVVDMAKKLGMHTLCEGVETQEQSDFLREIGCERQQGYLFSKPIPEEEFLAKLEAGQLEDPCSNHYYDQISQVNVLFDPMIDQTGQSAVGIKLPICILERGTDQKVRASFMNESCRRALGRYGEPSEGAIEQLSQDYPFKQTLLELMDESLKEKEQVGRVYNFKGKQYLLEVRYLAHDQKSQRDAFVYTFEGLAK
ncbi:EAL domain-containing protein [Lactobacillus sp.]|uniref:EAL domain-containing protein n=1 Tax=Lactobacillus sp. TaxID=1591 RepID=UPI003EFBD465